MAVLLRTQRSHYCFINFQLIWWVTSSLLITTTTKKKLGFQNNRPVFFTWKVLVLKLMATGYQFKHYSYLGLHFISLWPLLWPFLLVSSASVSKYLLPHQSHFQDGSLISAGDNTLWLVPFWFSLYLKRESKGSPEPLHEKKNIKCNGSSKCIECILSGAIQTSPLYVLINLETWKNSYSHLCLGTKCLMEFLCLPSDSLRWFQGSMYRLWVLCH